MVLLPGGACYWCETESLLLADLHLGREVSFRRAGFPLPEGPTLACLARVERVLETRDVRQVYILGDLVHARCSLSDDLEERIRQLLKRHSRIAFHLVEGNHDRRASQRLRQLGLNVVPNCEENGILLIHDASGTTERSISGHVHPGVRLPGEARRLPCFWVRPKQFLLPAFGDLTGTFEIKPARDESVYLVTAEMVFPYAARKGPLRG